MNHVGTATISLQRLKELEGMESALKKKKNIWLFDCSRGAGGYVVILNESETEKALLSKIASLESSYQDLHREYRNYISTIDKKKSSWF